MLKKAGGVAGTIPVLAQRAASEAAREQADRSSCSQSPHDKAVVARCAQLRAPVTPIVGKDFML